MLKYWFPDWSSPSGTALHPPKNFLYRLLHMWLFNLFKVNLTRQQKARRVFRNKWTCGEGNKWRKHLEQGQMSDSVSTSPPHILSFCLVSNLLQNETVKKLLEHHTNNCTQAAWCFSSRTFLDHFCRVFLSLKITGCKKKLGQMSEIKFIV